MAPLTSRTLESWDERRVADIAIYALGLGQTRFLLATRSPLAGRECRLVGWTGKLGCGEHGRARGGSPSFKFLLDMLALACLRNHKSILL